MAEPDAGGSLSTAAFRAVAHALEEHGLCAKSIFAAGGLAHAVVQDHRARVPIAVEHRVWAEVMRRSNNPAIGLSIGESIARRGRLTVDIYLALHSGTPRGALQVSSRFCHVGDDLAHFDLIEQDAVATVRTYRDSVYPRAPGFLDALLAAIKTVLADRTPGFRVRAVGIRRPRPARIEPYFAMFGVVPTFAMSTNELTFDRALLDVPLRGSDAGLAEILAEQAMQLLRDSPRIAPLVAAVQRVLGDGLARRQVSLSGVARALGTSERTLRRKLALLGTSFQALLEGVRRDLADFHLREGDDSVEHIAERLGFSTTSAFQRAFQRWHGVPPSHFRAAARGQRTGAPPF